MKHPVNTHHVLFFLFLFALVLFENCGTTEEEKPNKGPTCKITSPLDNADIVIKTTVEIKVSATDPDGSVASVKISIDGTTVATLQSPPYNYSWNTDGTALGQHNIKAVATDDGGLTDMSQIVVNITAQGPTVTTSSPVTDITDNSATAGGEVTDDGGADVTARGVVWGESNDPTLESNVGFTQDGTGTGTFASSLTGLKAKTTYYVRAYATNNSGTAYGSSVQFETLPGPATITTGDASNIGAYLAVGGGTVTSYGGSADAEVGVVWSTTPNPDYQNRDDFYQLNNFTGDAFEFWISGLKENTTYYYKAYAHNDNGFSYGEEKSFTTQTFSVTEGTTTDSRDNKQYKTVEIYGQVWLAENLAYLPEVCPPDTECGYWVYDYQGTDVAAAKGTANYADYGVLYNWEMAKNACPAGWHLPASDEWSVLEMNLGMDHMNAFSDANLRGTDEGNKLKVPGDTYWFYQNSGTNVARFNAVGAGEHNSDNTFKWLTSENQFWTISTANQDWIICRKLQSSSARIYRSGANVDASIGYSVRCVQD